MKTLFVWAALAAFVASTLCLTGCSGGDGPPTKEEISKINSGLPPDNGHGPGTAGLNRPGSGGPGGKK